MNIVFDIPGNDEHVSWASSDIFLPSKGQKIEIFHNETSITKKYSVREIEFKMTKIINIYCDTIIIYLEECD